MLTPGSEYVVETRAKVLDPVDVVVAGGGTAGVVAALAAARGGAKTMLVESKGFLGGMLTAGNAGITMYTKFSGRPEEHVADLQCLATAPQ
ncbi:MAG: FAD-dependent oxidoreductase, partial [Victivallales bacterium]|nr:FAD-dependent oxidoreductase [Victivallales bacterium]